LLARADGGGGRDRYDDRRGGGYDDRRGDRYDDRRGGGYDDRRGCESTPFFDHPASILACSSHPAAHLHALLFGALSWPFHCV
jgi:hypothetical protein